MCNVQYNVLCIIYKVGGLGQGNSRVVKAIELRPKHRYAYIVGMVWDILQISTGSSLLGKAIGVNSENMIIVCY